VIRGGKGSRREVGPKKKLGRPRRVLSSTGQAVVQEKKKTRERKDHHLSGLAGTKREGRTKQKTEKTRDTLEHNVTGGWKIKRVDKKKQRK